jgi:uncharacterized protein (TIGR02328 family)
VFTHETEWLVGYHMLVMEEMRHRGYNPDSRWYNAEFRGNNLGMDWGWADQDMSEDQYAYAAHKGGIIYPEHNQEYLEFCIELLKSKDAPMDFETIEKELLNGGKNN